MYSLYNIYLINLTLWRGAILIKKLGAKKEDEKKSLQMAFGMIP